LTLRIEEKVIDGKVTYIYRAWESGWSARKPIAVRKTVVKNFGSLKDHSPRTG
jgi:hypothetical protein